ncbi:sugar transferase [Actinomycetospora sp. CA-101289]|uniref:sugar transferase n=1 Tax=Actinomycetospora sp. CA-101289 TaxID=3239893 RepID=UPI003D985922
MVTAVGARRPSAQAVRPVAAVGAAVAVALAAVAVRPAPGVALGVLVGLGALAVVALAARVPVAGTCLYVGTLPFLAGIGRDTLVPLLRPHEALLVLVVLGGVAGWWWRWVRYATPLRPVRHPVDGPLLAFVVLATVWPVASLMLRGGTPSAADLAEALPVAKLAVLYVLVRATVRTDGQVLRIVRLVVWPAVVVAVVAVLQTLQVGPVLTVLQLLWASQDSPADLQERGTTTLGSPLATGDVLVVAAVVLVSCAARGLLGRREAVIAGVPIAAGILATGQVSTWLSACVAAAFLLVALPDLRRRALRSLLPVLLIALAAGAPALAGRFRETSGLGIPVSWLTRWDNLTHFYLPALGDFGFLLGVRPASVLPAPETWRDVVYLESGYLELLWVGGLPLLLGFAWLTVAVLRTARAAAARTGPRAAVGAALRVCWWTIVVVSVLDAHLTLRGGGDLLFVLLALAVGVTATPSHPVRRGGGPPTAPTPAPARRDPAPAGTPAIGAARRTTDVVVALLGLALLGLPMLVLGAAVRASSPGPALLRQRRVGLHRQTFVLFKFRTMRIGDDSDEALRALIAAELQGEDTLVEGSTKLYADTRVTRLGAWLRRTSLDELPQLLNVLRGEMTLVGPRPCLEWEAPMFPSEYAARFSVLPGLTGLWQVSGRSGTGTLDMLRLDLDYVRGRGLRQDLAIVLRTLPVLLRGDGAR